MKIKEKMFGFEIKQKQFKWNNQRPIQPNGYIAFNLRKANCQSGKCPNCGAERPGIGSGKRNGGFQDRQIQNLWRSLKRINDLGCDHSSWKPIYDLFSIDIIPERGELNTMIKCHPSRYSIGEFLCCGAQIWHDFFDDPAGEYTSASWKYYFHPTRKNNSTLQRWF